MPKDIISVYLSASLDYFRSLINPPLTSSSRGASCATAAFTCSKILITSIGGQMCFYISIILNYFDPLTIDDLT